MLDRKFLIWTKKGGCGKTNIATEIALRLEYPIITNEKETMLTVAIPEGKYLILNDDDEVPDVDSGVIFDFGGYIDARVIQAAKLSYCTVIPTLPEVSDIQGCISTIQSLKKYCDRIVVVANKTETKSDLDTVKNAISEIGEYPVFEIKKSRALPNIYIEKKPIRDMMNDNPLLKFSYRKVSEQFDELCYYLLNVE